MRADEYRQMLSKQKGNKYGAKKVGGHASKKEHYRSAQLQQMERAGLIADLREQVSYELIPAQYAEVDGRIKCVERSLRYVADFVYRDLETGKTVVEDTKGFRTKEYTIKRKLMLYLKGIRIKEI